MNTTTQDCIARRIVLTGKSRLAGLSATKIGGFAGDAFAGRRRYCKLNHTANPDFIIEIDAPNSASF